MSQKEAIAAGKTALGIEFGSTRIKAVLIGEDHVPLASREAMNGKISLKMVYGHTA